MSDRPQTEPECSLYTLFDEIYDNPLSRSASLFLATCIATAPMQDTDKYEFVKNPVVAEFLGLAQNTDFTESCLEGAIITHLQKFMMELGKGYAFAFVARQQHIHTEKQDYYIDLVFYNYILKAFVLIDC